MSQMHLQHMGRWGNQMFGVAFALGYAHLWGLRLTMDPWAGSQVFDLPNVEYCETPANFSVRNEHDLPLPEGDFTYRSYSQCQNCACYYTREQLRSWFKFKPEIAAACEAAIAHDTRGGAPDRIVCHLRRGDFAPLGYPVIALGAFKKACDYYGLDWQHPGITFLGDEDPTPHAGYVPDEISFIVDFYRMVKAPTLLRSNSSFSFWGGALSEGLVLSPVIDDLAGGVEHTDVRFIPNNSAKLANFGFITPIHINER